MFSLGSRPPQPKKQPLPASPATPASLTPQAGAENPAQMKAKRQGQIGAILGPSRGGFTGGLGRV